METGAGGRAVSRVLYPFRGGDHSSGTRVSPGLQRPTRELGAGHPRCAPLFGLAPGGVYRAGPVARTAGELLPHRFTLTRSPARLRAGRSVLCGTFLRVAPTGRYPAPCPVEPGLSSPGAVPRGGRPPSRCRTRLLSAGNRTDLNVDPAVRWAPSSPDRRGKGPAGEPGAAPWIAAQRLRRSDPENAPMFVAEVIDTRASVPRLPKPHPASGVSRGGTRIRWQLGHWSTRVRRMISMYIWGGIRM